MADNAPILDLETLITRPRVKIDGHAYEILAPVELSILDHQRLTAWSRRYDALAAKDSLGADEEREIEELVIKTSDLIMEGVPAAARKRLTGAQRLDVIDFFITALLRRKLTAAQMPLSPSIGAKRSRASSASTAATPAGGSKARRSRSSART